WGGATEHENIPPFEGGQRSRRGREGDVQPAGTGTPPGGCATTTLKGGFSSERTRTCFLPSRSTEFEWYTSFSRVQYRIEHVLSASFFQVPEERCSFCYRLTLQIYHLVGFPHGFIRDCAHQ